MSPTTTHLFHKSYNLYSRRLKYYIYGGKDMKKIYRVGFVCTNEIESENSLGRFIEKYEDCESREKAAKTIREMDNDGN